MYRQLDSKSGRWVSKDPIGFSGKDLNLYRYVGNKALSYSDPYGQEAIIYYAGNGDAVLAVTNPPSPTGYTYMEFYPTRGGSTTSGNISTGTQGIVDIISIYAGQLTPVKSYQTTPDQDLQIIQLAKAIQSLADDNKYKYSFAPSVLGIITGEDTNNCWGSTDQACGSVCIYLFSKNR